MNGLARPARTPLPNNQIPPVSVHSVISGFLLDGLVRNMVELFPNIDDNPLPREAQCPPDDIDTALVKVRSALGQLTKNLHDADRVGLMLFEMQMQQQQ